MSSIVMLAPVHDSKLMQSRIKFCAKKGDVWRLAQQKSNKSFASAPTTRMQINLKVVAVAAISCGIVGFVIMMLVITTRPQYLFDALQQQQHQSPHGIECVDKTTKSSESQSLRVLCFVMATVDQESLTSAAIIKQTWAKHCDISLFVSSDPLPGIPDTFLVDRIDNESGQNLYGKLINIWKRIYAEYKDQADWFIKADDDTFMVIPNLKEYIWSQWSNDTTTPRYIGRRFKLGGDPLNNFNSGGAGYGLNRAALDKFMEGHSKQQGHCRFMKGPEDVYTAQCLKQQGIVPEDTRDELGRERFNAMKLEWLFDPKMHDQEGWYQRYSYNLEKFEGCCSSQLISFHWLTPQDLRMYYYLFYGVQ
jgi:glycoprotein-N-acetylgalactosamine 3-beta-galactosyltransferase